MGSPVVGSTCPGVSDQWPIVFCGRRPAAHPRSVGGPSAVGWRSLGGWSAVDRRSVGGRFGRRLAVGSAVGRRLVGGRFGGRSAVGGPTGTGGLFSRSENLSNAAEGIPPFDYRGGKGGQLWEDPDAEAAAYHMQVTPVLAGWQK